MEKVGFQYQIVAHVKLTAQDIACLMECSKQHYDGVCKAAGQLGGKFFGWKNMLELETDFDPTRFLPKKQPIVASVTVGVNASDIGLMIKTLEWWHEMSDAELMRQLLTLRNEIEQEYHRVNT